MMRVLSIIAIVAAVILVIGSAVFINQVSESRSAALYEIINSYNTDSVNNYSMADSYSDEAASDTMIGGVFTLVVLLFIERVFLLSLLKIKTKTMKIMSIIGMSLCGILILVSFAPIASPHACSYNEIGALFTLFGISAIAFFIIGTIHSFRVKA